MSFAVLILTDWDSPVACLSLVIHGLGVPSSYRGTSSPAPHPGVSGCPLYGVSTSPPYGVAAAGVATL